MHTSISFILRVSLLTSIATVLLYWHIPLPLMPTFLTLDISDVPVLIGTLLFGLPTGITIAIVKNLLHLLTTSSFGIGELANTCLSVSYITVVWLLSRRGWIAYMVATVVLAFVAVVLNFTILLPLYQAAFHITTTQLLAITRAAGNPTWTIWDFMWWVIVPFNLVKGGLIALVSVPITKRLALFLKK